MLMALLFESVCALLPAGAVLVLEPLIAIFERVEGLQGGGLVPAIIGRRPIVYLADDFQLAVLMLASATVKPEIIYIWSRFGWEIV